MDIIPALQLLGFAEYEARVYVALVRRSPLNGYEIAKASGVPRPNVYAVLERLSARRAVLRLDEHGGATRYAAVAPAELLHRLSVEYQAVADEANRALEALAGSIEEEPVWNVRGYQALLDQTKEAIRAARHSLLVALWPQEATHLRDGFAEAQSREVAITTLCMAACERECGSCRGRVYRYRVADGSTRALVTVRDDAEVLAGEAKSAGEALSVKTRQRLLVEISSAYIRHCIALATIVEDLGPRLDELISPRTRETLQTLGTARGGDFLREVRRLIRSS